MIEWADELITVGSIANDLCCVWVFFFFGGGLKECVVDFWVVVYLCVHEMCLPNINAPNIEKKKDFVQQTLNVLF